MSNKAADNSFFIILLFLIFVTSLNFHINLVDLLVVGYLVYKYPLTDEKLDEINREIEARHKK